MAESIQSDIDNLMSVLKMSVVLPEGLMFSLGFWFRAEVWNLHLIGCLSACITSLLYLKKIRKMDPITERIDVFF